MIKCKYCNLECKNLVGLNRHNRLAHNIDSNQFKLIYKEYYPQKTITPDMIQCKICNEYSLPLGMPSHLSRKHNLSSIDYYNKYIKTESEGICKICGNPTSFRGLQFGYSKYCSSRCANLDPEVQEKLKKSNIEKYGVEHPLQSQKIKDKIKQTCIDKYGVDSYMKTKEFRQKSIEATQSKEVIEKRRKTNQQKYGADTPLQSAKVQDKIKQTFINNYGVSNPYASKEIKEKIKNTCLQKYGCENGGASKEAQVKIKNTRNIKSIEFCKQNNCIPLKDLDVDYSVKDSIFHSRLLLFNDRYYVKKEDINEILNHTPKSTGQSVVENAISSYIKSIYTGKIVRNTRSIISPKELDIYMPDKNLAIEIDGIWYHSTNNYTPKDYHLSKTKACEAMNIRLIHITDWEWENKPEICKSIIANAIGISENKIYARNCTIKEVSQNDTDNFLNINHLQGKIKATYRLGLYYKDELVQLICIGKSRFKNNEVELLRMCTKLNTRVIGGFSKLLNYQPYSEIISYIDRSKFNGNSYNKIGFKVVSETSPSYKYYKHNIELNRIAAQKHRLPELLGDKFNSSETESQNMIRNGWLQVYDCGTIKVQWVR